MTKNVFMRQGWADILSDEESRWLWGPPFAGTTGG
jgi:hypothetical protein